MKLNLLPTYVSKEGQVRIFVAAGVLLLLLSIGAAFLMVTVSRQQLAQAVDRATQAQVRYADAVATSQRADQIMAAATGIDKNIKLASAMDKHNSVIVNLYDEVLSYVPSFFRVTNISYQASGQGCTVTLSGVLSTFQQYADANMALLRIPGVTSVVRSGYAVNDPFIPALTETDQAGQRIRPGETNVPSNPMEALDHRINQAAGEPTGFLNEGGFGTSERERGPMPGASAVTFTLAFPARNVQVPNPRATITAATPGPGASPTGGI